MTNREWLRNLNPIERTFIICRKVYELEEYASKNNKCDVEKDFDEWLNLVIC